MENSKINEKFIAFINKELPQWDGLESELQKEIITAWNERELALQCKTQLIIMATEHNSQKIDYVNDIEKADARFERADANLAIFINQAKKNNLTQTEENTSSLRM